MVWTFWHKANIIVILSLTFKVKKL